MNVPAFAYLEAESLKDACGLLRKHSGGQVLAGGTDLLVKMKHRRVTASIRR